MNRPPTSHRSGPRGAMWAFLGFLAIAGFFLFTEHRAHALGVLPFALVALCLLLYIVGHRGHGGHGAPKDAP